MVDFLTLVQFVHEQIEYLHQSIQVAKQESLRYLQDTFEYVATCILAYIFVCIVFYLVTVYLDISTDCGHIRSARRVLFVTAHPDDECMFFGPSIIKIAQQTRCQLHLLCLSDGNYQKKGAMRKKELWGACSILGIPDSNVTILNNDFLPDNGSVTWREDIVAYFVLNHIEALSIDTVITFDSGGVSSHQNHVSIYYAVVALCLEKKLPIYCKAYALETASILRKYTGFFDLPISALLSTYCYTTSFKERKQIQEAMKVHVSQYVWYRKLYMIFSRYTFMNTLKEIEDIDLELDFEPR